MKKNIDSKVATFISAYANKLWARLSSKVPYSTEPLRYALLNHHGFCAAFEVMFDREPSKLESDLLKLNLYELEHTFLAAKGHDAVGFRYHASMPNGYLVKLRSTMSSVVFENH